MDSNWTLIWHCLVWQWQQQLVCKGISNTKNIFATLKSKGKGEILLWSKVYILWSADEWGHPSVKAQLLLSTPLICFTLFQLSLLRPLRTKWTSRWTPSSISMGHWPGKFQTFLCYPEFNEDLFSLTFVIIRYQEIFIEYMSQRTSWACTIFCTRAVK